MGAAAQPLRTVESPAHPRPPRRIKARALFEGKLVRAALKESFVMLRPDIQWSNPVMFVVEAVGEKMIDVLQVNLELRNRFGAPQS